MQRKPFVGSPIRKPLVGSPIRSSIRFTQISIRLTVAPSSCCATFRGCPVGMTMQTKSSSAGYPECRLSISVKESFDLEKTVCSYGFFLMAPNVWNHSTCSLQRPLRLADDRAVMVCISQSNPARTSLVIRAMGVDTLSQEDEQRLKDQVVRMLRLSDEAESAVSRFHALHPDAKAKGFGRLFRSPTLFEDMVRGILLCNCGWGRTLAMSRSLCELQSELKGYPLGLSTTQDAPAKRPCMASDDISPQTPSCKDLKRKRSSRKPRKVVVNMMANNFLEHSILETCSSNTSTIGVKICKETRYSQTSEIKLGVESVSVAEEDSGLPLQSLKASSTDVRSDAEFPSLTEPCMASLPNIGDFPTPKELASLDENFLAKRCVLGYRAKRILKLAGSICEGTIDLGSLESADGSTHLNFEDLKTYLLNLDGFGPFTCSNVLMCMGDYRSIPADSETMRHLRQVHGRSNCTVRNVAREVEEVYAQYAPFQFLAYWSEMWDCYEKKFGKLSEMLPTDYHRITGNNMSKKESKPSSKEKTVSKPFRKA